MRLSLRPLWVFYERFWLLKLVLGHDQLGGQSVKMLMKRKKQGQARTYTDDVESLRMN